MNVKLPQPSPEDQKNSDQLQQKIADIIRDSGGHISFEQYMHECLYAEQLGYYESEREIFGGGGDFTTSPERSRYFALAFAAHLQKIHASIGEFTVIELGAGSGQFAVDLIAALTTLGCIPSKYLILEKSRRLQERQQALLKEKCVNNSIEVNWISELEEKVQCGIVIANEVLDAIPVRLINVKNQQLYERCVGISKDRLEYVDVPADKLLAEKCSARLPEYLFENRDSEYQTEINTSLPNFVEQIAALVNTGIFFYIDYGYPRGEYYQQSREMGTLICHYRHIANDQVLLWPGLQDISSNVDFTALAEAADSANLQLSCYSTQAHFLLASDFLSMIEANNNAEAINEQAELKRLMMPGEMGERFQVMVLTKDINIDGSLFTMRDLSYRL